MSYRFTYFDIRREIRMADPTNPKRSFFISEIGVINGIERLNFISSLTEEVNCPYQLLRKLLEMMRFTNIVQITGSRGPKTIICVTESDYLCSQIITVIKSMISKTYYPNLSKLDADAIIAELKLSSDVYCVESDHSGCLVVLHQVNKDSCQYNYHRLPYVLFQQKYEEINQPRTVVMTPAQRDTLLSDEKKSSVEFSSVLPDGQIEVVFRRDAIRTVVPEIKNQVEIDNIRRRLEVLTSSK